jgi:transcriptional regulator with XRE-family HTH domain
MGEAHGSSLGQYLRAVRIARGWSLRVAAKQIGIAHSRVDEIERMIDARTGKPFVPSYINVVKIARAYDLPLDDLLRRAGYTPGIELAEDEWRLLGLYRQLTPGQREALFTLLKECACLKI